MFHLRDLCAAIKGFHKLRLFCDASRDGSSAALVEPQVGKSVRPKMFIDRATLDNERNWSILKLEAETIVWTIEPLQSYLFLTSFVISSDNEALERLFKGIEHEGPLYRRR